MRIHAVGLSDVGRARSHNEDCYEIDVEHGLYVVADGMGGHSHGEVASRLAVDAISDFAVESASEEATWPFPYDARFKRHSNRLRMAIRVAHLKVLQAIRQDRALTGMGTTVVGCMVDGATAAVAHVGDSRAYYVHQGRLDLLTQDHTWVNEQVVAGYLSVEQARAHPLKNVVTRALGGEAEVVVDVREIELEEGDRLLLCSDGLTTMLSDTDLEHFLTTEESIEEICRELVREANRRGGFDNVTVVMLEALA